MTDFQYKKPPITEAVVEFRSTTIVDEKKRKKALNQLGKLYSRVSPLTQQKIEVALNSNNKPKTHTTDTILNKFSSDDMTKQLLVGGNLFLISQIAPYTGWINFKDRIMRDWECWRKYVGFQAVNRVGMRFINRIDIPRSGPLVYYEEYLNVYPLLPAILDPSMFHSLSVKVELKDIQSVLDLKSASVESPLPDHMAIVVDLDISRVFDSPPSAEDIYTYIDQARIRKNEIFEACIKEKAREMFNS